MNYSKALVRLQEIEEAEARKRGLSVETFRRMLWKVEEHEDDFRAKSLPEELLQILKEDRRRRKALGARPSPGAATPASQPGPEHSSAPDPSRLALAAPVGRVKP